MSMLLLMVTIGPDISIVPLSLSVIDYRKLMSCILSISIFYNFIFPDPMNHTPAIIQPIHILHIMYSYNRYIPNAQKTAAP